MSATRARPTLAGRWARTLGVWISLVPASGWAAPDRKPSLGALLERVQESEARVVEAERAAAKEVVPSESQLAERLLDAQLALADGRTEAAAIRCLDIVENHPDTVAAVQAKYFLGVALHRLGMHRWAVELLSTLLVDASAEAERLRQRTVARLLDVAAPRRPEGFARRPGLSALPEIRARMEAVGVSTDPENPRGPVSPADADRLLRWATSFPEDAREPDLRYAHGRFLYLRGEYEAAQVEMDLLSPLDIPMSRGGPEAQWRLRAAYVGAACSAALGEFEDALQRLERLVGAHPGDPRDRQIVDLGHLARARILHDQRKPEQAIRAYREVDRDSVYFPEAVYETAWTLLEGRRFDQAVAALDLLIEYEPDSPWTWERKQLRGKVKIRAHDDRGAAREFKTLYQEYGKLARELEGRLRARGGTVPYLTAAVADQLEHFTFDAVLPRSAVPIAARFGSARAAVELARETGHLEHELSDLMDLLARMEFAVASPDKARLFADLGAHVAALDNVDDEVVEIREAVLARGIEVHRLFFAGAEGRRQAIRRRLDATRGTSSGPRRQLIAKLDRLEEQSRALDGLVDRLRATLVGVERSVERASAGSVPAVLERAGELRSELTAMTRQATEIRQGIGRAHLELRLADPVRAQRDALLGTYLVQLDKMYEAVSERASDEELDDVWKRTESLRQRAAAARDALEVAAAARLDRARRILIEERVNLDAYRADLEARGEDVRAVVGETLDAVYEDVAHEAAVMSVRSEVGMLDVIDARKQAEVDALERVETQRDIALRELQRSVQMGLEDLQP